MSKFKIFLYITFLAFILISCSQNKDGILIEGSISEINEERGEIVVEGDMTLSETISSTESFKIKETSKLHTIRVSNPEKYEIGDEMNVNVMKTDDDEIWNVDK